MKAILRALRRPERRRIDLFGETSLPLTRQMICVDPPYGIKYASSFQPRADRRDVKGHGQGAHP